MSPKIQLRNSAMRGGDDKGRNRVSGWSWEENKFFEVALVTIGDGAPDCWETISAVMGGRKTAEEVEKHYQILLEDLDAILSGSLDHVLDETFYDGEETDCLTDEDVELLRQMKIK